MHCAVALSQHAPDCASAEGALSRCAAAARINAQQTRERAPRMKDDMAGLRFGARRGMPQISLTGLGRAGTREIRRFVNLGKKGMSDVGCGKLSRGARSDRQDVCPPFFNGTK